MCLGGGLALAGPGMWARLTLERSTGSVQALTTRPVDKSGEAVALEVTFLFATSDDSRHIGYGICDAYGAPLPDPVLSATDAEEFMRDYWQRRAFRFPVYWDSDATAAKMYFTDKSHQELYYKFGLILLLCPLLSLLPVLWLSRRSRL